MPRANFNNFLKWGIAAGLLLVLASQVDLTKARELLRRIDAVWLALALALFPIGICLSAFKWQLLLASQGLSYGFWALVRFYWIGFFANNFFLSSVGGDVSRIVLLRRKGRTAEITASVIVERFTGLLVLLFWAGCGLSLLGGTLPDLFLSLLWVIIICGLVLTGLLLFCSRSLLQVSLRLNNCLRQPLFCKGGDRLVSLTRALAAYNGETRTIFLAIGLSIPFYITPWLLQWLLFHGSGVEVSSGAIFAIVPLVIIASLIPLTPNGLGLSEGASVYLYALAGVSAEAALMTALLGRLLVLIASATGGLLWLVKSN